MGRSGGQTSDGHRLDDGKWVVLAHDAVFECAGFRLVAVGHHVLVRAGFVGHRPPFDAGGEGGPAPPRQSGVGDGGNDRVRPHLDRSSQGLIAAVLPVGLQGGGIYRAYPAEHTKTGVARLGQPKDLVVIGRHPIGPAHALNEVSRGPLALSQTGAGVDFGPAGLQRCPQFVVAGQGAGGVDAHMDNVISVARISSAEQLVESGYAEGFSRGNPQPLGRAVQTSGADPADLVLEGVQYRQQQVAKAPAPGAAPSDQPLGLGNSGGICLRDYGINRGPLGIGGLVVAEVKVSQRMPPRSRGHRPALPSPKPP